jgi:hypothetical protein
MKLIQAQLRQDCVGKDHSRTAWEGLLPLLGNPNVQQSDRMFYIMPKGSLLSERFKGKTLRSPKHRRGERYFNSFQKEGLRVLLTRDIGLKSGLTQVLVSRPISHFRRIEEFISGLVDSLWLADEQVFVHQSSELKLIRKLVRKVFAVGTYNLYDLVDQWKEWGNFLFHTLAETSTIGEVSVPAENNIFRLLNGIPYISKVYHGDKSMLLMQHVSHLISSRQMPYMGLQTELKAREKYREVLTSSFKPDDEIIMTLSMAARRVGAICRKLHPVLNEGECHVSVNSSGELDHPIESGGQASAVREALIRVLTRVPENDEEEDTPFGIVRHHAGIPIWRTLFRKEPYMFAGEFLEPYTLWSQWEIRVREGRFRGLDEDTGKQLMYVAWKEYRPLPVLRAEVVPEMGNKARHVTLSEYWLNVIQAPLSHTLVSAMKYHPSVFSSFHRQDQAWEAVKGLCRSERPYLAPGEAVLSSDLKDATNAQQWELTKSILKGFIQGYKLSFRSSYVDLVLGTIGPRLVLLSDNTSVLTTVGIMMGEAIAKPSLTLLNRSIEEAAFITCARG